MPPDAPTVTVVIALSSIITLLVVLFLSLGIVCFSLKKKQRGDDNRVQANTTQPASVRFVDIIAMVYLCIHNKLSKLICAVRHTSFQEQT